MSERAQEILQAIAALVEELATLQVSEDPATSPASAASAPPTRPPILREGDRVKIIRRDKHHGRTGVLLDRHGSLFWNIRLDRLPEETMSVIIYKTDASLRLLQD